MNQAEWGWWFGLKRCGGCGMKLVAMPTERGMKFVCPDCDMHQQLGLTEQEKDEEC